MSEDKTKNNIIGAILAVAVAIGLIVGITYAVSSDDSSSKVSTSEESAIETETSEKEKEQTETDAIDNDIVFSADQQTATYQGETGRTALEVLQSLTEVSGTDDPSLGFYVTGINGLEADSAENEFWAFYVDGETSQVGAGSHNSVDGEELKWVLETF